VQLGDHWLELKHALAGLDYIVAALVALATLVFIWRHVRP
jgi:hypothetical protein